MHSRGYAHMDLKPHNVLIRRPRSQQQHQPGPVSVPRSASRPRIRAAAAAAADSGDEGDIEAGTSLVSPRGLGCLDEDRKPVWSATNQLRSIKQRSSSRSGCSFAGDSGTEGCSFQTGCCVIHLHEQWVLASASALEVFSCRLAQLLTTCS